MGQVSTFQEGETVRNTKTGVVGKVSHYVKVNSKTYNYLAVIDKEGHTHVQKVEQWERM